MIGFAAHHELEKEWRYRTKQIISLNIQQLPETDPLFNGYTGPIARARTRSVATQNMYFPFV